MNQNPLISIIIPIYNVEKQLSTCLESVCAQTYAHFEAILVNDGSTDSSKEIAQSFVEKEHRFRLINQENKGLSGARNTGVAQAAGDYIFYLDSDDVLVENAMQLLVAAARKYKADVVQGNFYYDYPDYLLLNKQQKEKEIFYNRKEAMKALLKHKTVLNFAWGNLIKTSLAQKYPFPEGKYYEDTFWKYKIIHEAQGFVALHTPILYYLQRETAISGSFSIRNLDQLEGEEQRLRFIQTHYVHSYYQQALKLLNQKLIQHTALLSQLTSEEQERYKNKIKELQDTYQLKQKFSKSYSGLNQKTKRILNGMKNRLGKNKDWERILK